MSRAESGSCDAVTDARSDGVQILSREVSGPDESQQRFSGVALIARLLSLNCQTGEAEKRVDGDGCCAVH